MKRRKTEELCISCIYRAEKNIFAIYRCDYALMNKKCRLDPSGFCTHYIRDENYDEEKEKRMLERVKEQKRRYSEKKRVFSLRPVGRPRKSEQGR